MSFTTEMKEDQMILTENGETLCWFIWKIRRRKR